MIVARELFHRAIVLVHPLARRDRPRGEADDLSEFADRRAGLHGRDRHLVPLGNALARADAGRRRDAGGISSTAMITLSAGLRRKARGVVMAPFTTLSVALLRRKQSWPLSREGLQQGAGCAEMTLHRLARGGRIARLDRLDDRLVLAEALSAFGRAATSRAAARARDERASRRGPRSRAPCRGERQDPMELDIESRRTPPGRRLSTRARLLLEIRRQRVLVGARHSARGLGRDLALQRAADEQALRARR